MQREEWAQLERAIVRCRRCPRLVAHREEVARVKRRAYREERYWGKPVPSFGSADPALWIVGLAPGAHGANRTGRMFTGDASGDFLYAALHRFGFASAAVSTSRDDGLTLRSARVTNVVKCVPPDNRPSGIEVETCRGFLLREVAMLDRARVIVALGRVAWDEVVRLWRSAPPAWGSPPAGAPPRFGHGAEWCGGARTVIASYHPSRQNTQTGRLTENMFDDVFRRARILVDDAAKEPAARNPGRPGATAGERR